MALQALWEVDSPHKLFLWKPLPPSEWVSPDEMDRLLHQDHWTMVNEQLEADLRRCMSGQLLKTRLFIYEDYPLSLPFGRERDIAQCHAVPVALGWPVPEQMAETPLEATDVLTAAQFFPPATFGQVGVIFSRDQRWTYPITVLAAEASQLQAELAASLQKLSESDFLRDSSLFQHAQVLAFRLACWYREYHQAHPPVSSPVQIPGEQLDLSGHPAPENLPIGTFSIPSLFQSGTSVLIPTPLPTRAILAATSAAKHSLAKWAESDEGIPTFLYQEPEGTTAVEVRPHQLAVEIDEHLKAALWDIVRHLSPLESAIFLALLGFTLATPADETGNHWIPVERLLEARGIRPKMKDGWRAGDHQDDKVRVAEGVDRLNALWLQIEQGLLTLFQPGAVPIQEQWSHHSKLLHIEGVLIKKRLAGITTSTHYFRQDVPLATGRGLPVAWHLHWGTWLQPFLQGPNRQLSHLSQQSLSYEIVDEQWEFLLAQYLTLLRAHAGGQSTLHFKVGTLFDELSLPINHRHPQKTIDRFHQAWRSLHDDKQVIQVKLHYDQSEFPTHKWLETWFNCSLTVYLPPPKE